MKESTIVRQFHKWSNWVHKKLPHLIYFALATNYFNVFMSTTVLLELTSFGKIGCQGIWGGGQRLFKSTGPLGQWLQELNVEGCISSQWFSKDSCMLEDFLQNFNLHRANLGSTSFTTHSYSLYLSCTSHLSRNVQSPWAGMSKWWKGKLDKERKWTNWNSPKITKMDPEQSSREELMAPSGDYVLLAPSGECNQTILGISFSRTLL